MLRRNPGMMALAVLALGLGIGSNSAVFTVLNGVLLRPLPFPQPDDLLLLSDAPAAGPFGPSLGMVESEYLDLLADNRVFERIATFNQSQTTLTGVGEACCWRFGACPFFWPWRRTGGFRGSRMFTSIPRSWGSRWRFRF